MIRDAESGEVLVGEVAKRQAITNPDRTFRSIKRHMGEDWKSEDVDGKKYTPQEISARILMKLKTDAESYLGDKVTDEKLKAEISGFMGQEAIHGREHERHHNRACYGDRHSENDAGRHNDHLDVLACGQKPSKHPGEADACDLTEARDFLARNRVLLGYRGGGVLVLEPVGAGGHDDLVALLVAQAIFGENPAFVLGPVGLPLAALLGPLLLDELVGGEIGEIVERLDAGLAERDQHCLVEVRKLGQRVLDAKAATFLAGSRLAALERFGGAALKLGGDIVVVAAGFVIRAIGGADAVGAFAHRPGTRGSEGDDRRHAGHHHVGNIGILGVDKKGEEFYQVALGGSADRSAAIGKVLGPSFAQDEMPDVIEKIITVYLQHRQDGEKFIDTYNRIGLEPFKEFVYAPAH